MVVDVVKAVAADHMKSSPNPAPILFLGFGYWDDIGSVDLTSVNV